MPERRTNVRHRVFKSGLINFNRVSSISCTIRNISAHGACVEIASHIGIPNEFTLVIQSDQFTRSCRVTWRANNRIGVAF